jgi:hypothetical protein
MAGPTLRSVPDKSPVGLFGGLQLLGDVRQVGGPGLNRIGGVDLAVQQRLWLVDQGQDRVKVFAGVGGKRGTAPDEAGVTCWNSVELPGIEPAPLAAETLVD